MVLASRSQELRTDVTQTLIGHAASYRRLVIPGPERSREDPKGCEAQPGIQGRTPWFPDLLARALAVRDDSPFVSQDSLPQGFRREAGITPG